MKGLILALMLVMLGAAMGTRSHGPESRSHPPGANMTTPEIIAFHGYPVETHHVTTEDGYILELHRIPQGINDTASTGRPVAFLQHCLLCSSADFIMNDPDKALAYMMADAGYDVWMGNYRGNTYSRFHTTIDPDLFEFWQFSWDEMATIDLPAMLDYTLASTGQPDLYYIGFSMGTTTLFAMLSEKPEYNDKIRVAACMGPAAYMLHMKGPLTKLAPFSDDLDMVMSLLGKGEFLPSRDVTDKLVEEYCDEEAVTAEVCYNILFLIAGPDPELVNKEYMPVILAHTPAGTSIHTVNHYAQLQQSGGFHMYNYGPLANQNHYGQGTPPNFTLSNVMVPVGLFWGQNDWLASPEDVVTLDAQLPNVALNYRVPWDAFNHLDFVWATTAYELVYGELMDFIAQY